MLTQYGRMEVNMRIDTIDTEEILHFLGYIQTSDEYKLDDVVSKTIEEMKSRVLELAVPRYVYREFELKNGHPVGIHLKLSGKDIQRLFKQSHHCILLAATLGTQIEKEGKRLQLQDMGKAVIFDSCASAAIEQVCDNLQEELRQAYEKKQLYLTDRYSCGYGDLPLTIQNEFLKVLDAPRKIGLYANDSCLLVPRKSVTAIIGISNHIQPAILRGCVHCLLRETCEFRRGGTVCGK